MPPLSEITLLCYHTLYRTIYGDFRYGVNMAIHIKKSHKGLLHKHLGVAPSKPIPMAKLQAAKKSSDPAVRREATFAINARGWNK